VSVGGASAAPLLRGRSIECGNGVPAGCLYGSIYRSNGRVVDQHSHCLSGAPSTVTGLTSRVSWGICIVRTRGGIVRLYGAYVLVSM